MHACHLVPTPFHPSRCDGLPRCGSRNEPFHGIYSTTLRGLGPGGVALVAWLPLGDMLHDAWAALRQAMALWRAPLKTLVRLPARTSLPAWRLNQWDQCPTSDEILWLQCPRRRNYRLFLLSLEAASLFALLAHVNLTLWKRLAREIWPRAFEWVDTFETRKSLRVGVDVCVRQRNDDGRLLCGDVVEWLHTVRSRQYQATREMFALAAGVSIDCLLYPPIRVNLEDAQRDDRIASLVGDVHKLLRRQPFSGLRVTQIKPPIVDVELNEQALHSLASIQAAGIQVVDLPALAASWVSQESLHCIYQLLNALPTEDDSTPHHPVASRKRPLVTGVETLVLSSTLPIEIVPWVCSAIHGSRSLRSVEVSFDTDDLDAWRRKRRVMWTTYALFCREPLDAVTFSTENCRVEDVEWMAQLLSTPDPLMLLLSLDTYTPHGRSPHGPEVPHDFCHSNEQAAAPAEALVHQPCTRKVPDGEESSNDTQRVIRRSDRLLPLVLSSPTQLIIRSLEEETVTPMLKMIQLVGWSVKHLTIDDVTTDDTLLDTFCEQALQACPRLEQLELYNVELQSLEFLLDACDAGTCSSLRGLEISSVQLEDANAFDSFLRSLADPQQTISHQLRILRIKVFDGDEAITNDTLDIAWEMLQHNSVLCNVALAVPGSSYVWEYETRFKQCNGMLLPELTPLDCRATLAFLSVIGAAQLNQQSPSAALFQFDSAICRRILRFAATPRIRRVSLSFT